MYKLVILMLFFSLLHEYVALIVAKVPVLIVHRLNNKHNIILSVLMFVLPVMYLSVELKELLQ